MYFTCKLRESPCINDIFRRKYGSLHSFINFSVITIVFKSHEQQQIEVRCESSRKRFLRSILAFRFPAFAVFSMASGIGVSHSQLYIYMYIFPRVCISRCAKRVDPISSCSNKQPQQAIRDYIRRGLFINSRLSFPYDRSICLLRDFLRRFPSLLFSLLRMVKGIQNRFLLVALAYGG